MTEPFRDLAERMEWDQAEIARLTGLHRTQVGRHLAKLRDGDPVRVYSPTDLRIMEALATVDAPEELGAYERGWRDAVAEMGALIEEMRERSLSQPPAPSADRAENSSKAARRVRKPKAE